MSCLLARRTPPPRGRGKSLKMQKPPGACHDGLSISTCQGTGSRAVSTGAESLYMGHLLARALAQNCSTLSRRPRLGLPSQRHPRSAGPGPSLFSEARMTRIFTPIAVGAALVASAPAFAQKHAVTIDDVMQLKAVAAPAVSPDGTEVVFTIRQWEPASERDKDRFENRTRIWMVPVAGGPARQIAYSERGDSLPQWSPDGRH